LNDIHSLIIIDFMTLMGFLKISALLGGVFSAPLAHAQTHETGNKTGQNITVFAAASLRGALDEIAQTSSDTVTLSYAGSGSIARQVSLGAPADAVILAHPRWMDWLNDKGIINTQRDIAHNSLVLIGAKNAPPLLDPANLSKRLDSSRLAMGQHLSVPAGIYAQSWLEHIGQWKTLSTQLAEVENVRLALALVARNEVPLGVVYRSDALADQNVSILYEVPAKTHATITYPASALTPKGAAFVALLTSPQAQAIFKSHGFVPLQVDN
jgi:molybdate transport system substrate-binding protein